MTSRRSNGIVDTSRPIRTGRDRGDTAADADSTADTAAGGRRWRIRPPSWLPRTASARRSLSLQLILLVALLVLSGRLVQVQAVDAQELRERSANQSERQNTLPPQRGRIFDRSGAVLATTVDRAAIVVDPSVVTAFHADDTIDTEAGEMSRRQVATALAGVLDVSRKDVMAALTDDPDSRFAYVQRKLDWDRSDDVMQLELPGVYRVVEPTRTYPNGAVAGPLLGFTNWEGEGVSGLEAQYESSLRGQPGQVLFEVDGSAALDIATSEREVTPSVPGDDLVLTIDREIQAAATRVATETMASQDAEAVSIVVLDADTAEVLAAASTPSFDPNDLTDDQQWRARPFTDAVEPGSVQKIVTMAAAWEEGVVDADTVVDVPNTWTVGGKTWDSHGLGAREMGIGEIVERSSNIGTMKVAEMLGPERLHDWLLTFGYGEPTGVGYPGESAGLVLPAEQWSATSLPTISIGHGVAMSTIQLASVYQTLANDGVRVQPTLVRGSLDDGGELVSADRPDTREVVSASTATAMRQMLQRVVEGEYGTGSRAAVDGYTVGGKTGTADKPLANGRGYSSETTAVFAGMAPIDDPELVVAVMVDEPLSSSGGVAAAPAFSEVMANALVARNVVPDTSAEPIGDALGDARAEGAAAAAEAAAAAQRELEAARQRSDDGGGGPSNDAQSDNGQSSAADGGHGSTDDAGQQSAPDGGQQAAAADAGNDGGGDDAGDGGTADG